MAMEKIKEGKLLYHLTKLSNLDSILEYGLVSRKLVKDSNVRFFDIADQEIISKRTELGLDAYTPFHFHPYSSFDVAVKKTYTDEEFIYICITRKNAEHNKFQIIPKHPLADEKYELYEYEKGFNIIEWDKMHTHGTEDNDIKNVKMAECITNLAIPSEFFQCIYVKNDHTKKIVEEKLKSKGINNKTPFVNIGPWL